MEEVLEHFINAVANEVESLANSFNHPKNEEELKKILTHSGYKISGSTVFYTLTDESEGSIALADIFGALI